MQISMLTLFLIIMAILLVIGLVKKFFKLALTIVLLAVIYLGLSSAGIIPSVTL